jgi:hypothetical protein
VDLPVKEILGDVVTLRLMVTCLVAPCSDAVGPPPFRKCFSLHGRNYRISEPYLSTVFKLKHSVIKDKVKVKLSLYFN